MKLKIALAGALCAAAFAGPQAWAQSDAQVRQAVIRQSIAAYSGACACPYSTARNGSRCGARSAHSRGGGAAPACYARDVSAADVAAHRRANAPRRRSGAEGASAR